VNFLLRRGETPWRTIKKYIDQQAGEDTTIREIPYGRQAMKKAIFYALFRDGDAVWIVTVTLSKRKSRQESTADAALRAKLDAVLGRSRQRKAEQTKWYQVTVRGETEEHAVTGSVNVRATSKHAALLAASAMSADSVQWEERDDRVLLVTRALHAEEVSL
jgi:hypothetical protein